MDGNIAPIGASCNFKCETEAALLSKASKPRCSSIRAAGCNEYQGFLFSRPLPVAQIDAMLAARTRRAVGVGVG